MAEDKGSDLDVFEGLAKKKPSSPPASVPAMPPSPGTLPGGLEPPAGGPDSVSVPSSPVSALPKATPPPSKKPLPPPTSSEGAAGIEIYDDDELVDEPTGDSGETDGGSEPPELSFDSADFVSIDDDEEEPASVLPGEAAADLDWDDEEEATQVFSRQGYGLFNDLAGKQFVSQDADQTAKRNVAKVAALLHSSGGEAAPVQSAPPPAVAPVTVAPTDSEPEIPAPAALPSDVAEVAAAREGSQAPPSWAPSMMPAPQQSRSTVVLALCALVAVCAAVYFIVNRAPATGTLIVLVEHQGKPVDKVDIWVNGRKQCPFSPCEVPDLALGKKSVNVSAGLLGGKGSIEMVGGGETTITVSLGESDASPLTTEQLAALASIKLSSKQSGIKVFVDGKEKGMLPLELKDLKPGKLSLRFEGGEKFGKLQRDVELKAGQTLTIDDIELPLQKVEVTFQLNLAGAKVTLLEDGNNAATLGFTGGKAKKVLDTSKSWSVKASAAGYRAFSENVRFEPGKDAQTFTIALAKETATTEGPKTGGTEAPKPKETTTTKPPPPAKMEQGILNANSIPPSKVIIDGRPRGSTPVTGVRVSPGSHSVVFIHKKYGRKSRRVTVAAGQTKTAVVRFKKKKKK